MGFAKDRDLLVLEPNLFRTAPLFVSQRLVKVSDGVIAGTTLTSAIANFEAVDIGAGHVVVADQVSLEVIDRISSTQLEVSRVRSKSDGVVLPPAPGTGLSVEIVSFELQIEMVHAQLMHNAGIALDGEVAAVDVGVVLSESMVVNVDEMVLLEGLGALSLVFNAVATLTGGASGSPEDALALRAQLYRERFDRLRFGARIILDTDGDGKADAVRGPAVMQFVRG